MLVINVFLRLYILMFFMDDNMVDVVEICCLMVFNYMVCWEMMKFIVIMELSNDIVICC